MADFFDRTVAQGPTWELTRADIAAGMAAALGILTIVAGSAEWQNNQSAKSPQPTVTSPAPERQ